MAHSHQQQQQQQRLPVRGHFWSHPAQYYHWHSNEDEAMDEPLLPSSRIGPRMRSLIPWSPGQTIASEHEFFGPTEEYEHSDHMGEEEENATTSLFCCARWFCFSCKCCCQSVQQQQTDSVRTPRRRNPVQWEPTRSTGGGYCMKFLHLLISVASFAGLCYYSSRFNNQHWTMNPGESRQVATAGFLLTDSVQVLSMTPPYTEHGSNETKMLGMAVFATGSDMDCPSLTGDPVRIDSAPQEIALLNNAFQYQYYYLNKGSTMQVTVYQSKGACNIMVLKGSKVLARMQNKKKSHIYQEDSEDIIADLELFFSATEVVMEVGTQQGSPIQFSFTSPASDVYVLLFDNAASNNPAAFNVSYHMVLTTYNLEGLVPWCSHSAPVDPSLLSTDEQTFFTCPPLDVKSAGCILVEATEKSYLSRNTTSSKLSFYGGDNVEITLYITRRWYCIGILSLVPSAVLALVIWLRQPKRRSQRRERHRHRDTQPSRHLRQDLEQRPNFHFLSRNSNHEATETGGDETDPTPVDQTTANALASSESNNEQGTADRTTLIPAENVTVVKNQES